MQRPTLINKVMLLSLMLILAFFWFVNKTFKKTETDTPLDSSIHITKHNQINEEDNPHTDIQPKTHQTHIVSVARIEELNSNEQNILEKLIWSGSLTTQEVDYIQANATKFVQILKGEPSTLSSLLSAFYRDEDNTDEIHLQLAGHAIFTALQPNEKQQLAKTLSQSVLSEERSIALTLMEPILGSSNSDLSTFNQLLSEEYDSRILARAINLAPNVKGQQNIQQTMDALSALMLSNHSQHATGMALIAKAKLTPSPEWVYDDILSGIDSYSDEIREHSLRALGIIIKKQNHQNDVSTVLAPDLSNDWKQDTNMRLAVQRILDNPNSSAKLRELAEELHLTSF